MSLLIETVSDSTKARKDLDALKKSVNGIESSLKGATEGFQKLAIGIGAAFAAFSTVSSIAKFSDQFTELENKIKAVTNSQLEFNKALDGVKNIAIQSRSGLKETASLYARIAINAKEIGIGQSSTLKVTGTVAKAMKISGATAAESQSAMLQFGQAIGSGALQGDELRSLLENAPVLARALATEFKTSVGNLKQLGETGQLVSGRVLKAILGQAEEIDLRFSKLKVTFGDAFRNLGTASGLLLDKLASAVFGSNGFGLAGVVNNLAINIKDLADNFKFYLLKIKTSVLIFVLDVNDFFEELWPVLRETGARLSEVFVGVYEYWKPELDRATALISEWASDTVNYVTAVFEKISGSELFKTIINTFSEAFATAKTFVKNIFSDFGIEIPTIDVTKFFKGFEPMKAYVDKFVKHLERAFFWLYDAVIGHSWIPDLVLETGEWLKKLIQKPLSYVKAFAKAASDLFARIQHSIPAVKSGSYLDKLITKFKQLRGVVNSTFNSSTFGRTFRQMTGQRDVGAPVYAGSDFEKTYGGIDQRPQAKVGRGPMRSSESRVIGHDFVNALPKDWQVPFVTGVAALFAGAIVKTFEGGPIRTALLSLMTTLAGVILVQTVDSKIIKDAVGKTSNFFVSNIAKGLDALFGDIAAKDPFGAISIIAKTMLLFKAGREYLGSVAKGLVTAPTQAALRVRDILAVKIGDKAVKKESANLDTLLKSNETLKKNFKDREKVFEESVKKLSKMTETGARGGTAIGPEAARAAIASGSAAAFANNQRAVAQLRIAADASSHLARLTVAHRDALALESTAAARRAALEAETGKIRAGLAESKAAFKQGVVNSSAGVGGTLGAISGYQLGAQFAESLGDKVSAWQKIGITIGASFVAQAIGAGIGTLLGSTLVKAGESVAWAIKGAFAVAPFITGAVLILAALVAGYALFTSLPDVWKKSLGFTTQTEQEDIKALRDEISKTPGGITDKQIDKIVTTFKEAGAVDRGFGPSAKDFALDPQVTLAQVAAIDKAIGPPTSALKISLEAAATDIQAQAVLYKATGEGIKALVNYIGEALNSIKDFATGRAPLKKATGGFIHGPGTGTSDDIPAMLSNGEFVVNAEDARKNRPLLTAINSGRRTSFFSGGSASFSDARFSAGLPNAYTPANPMPVTDKGLSAAFSKFNIKETLDTLVNKQTGSFDFGALKDLLLKTAGLPADLGKPKPNTPSLAPSNARSDSRSAYRIALDTSKKPLDKLATLLNDQIIQVKKDGAGITAKDLEGIDRGVQGKIAETLDNINSLRARDKKDGSFLSGQIQNNVAEQIDVINDLLKRGATTDADAFKSDKGKGGEKVKPVTFGEELKIINEVFPEMELSLKEFIKLGDKGQDIFKTANELRTKTLAINELPVGTKTKSSRAVKGVHTLVGANEALGEVEEQRAAAEQAAIASLRDTRSLFRNIGKVFQEVNVGVTESQINSLFQQDALALEATAIGLKTLMKKAAELPIGASEEDRQKMAKQIAESTASLQTSVQDALLKPLKGFDLLQGLGNRVNFAVERSVFNKLKDADAELLKGYLIALSKDESDAKVGKTAEIRADAQARAEKGRKNATNIISKDDKALGAGQAYASNIKSSFETGFRGIFEGKENGEGVLRAALDTFANGVMDSMFDTVAKSFTERLFSPDKIMKSFESDGSSLFNLFSGGGKKEGGSSESGTDSPTGILSGIWGAITSFVSPLLAFFGFSQAASAVETSTAVADSVSLSLIAANTSVMAAMSGSEAAGSILGVLAATGGYVSGPGTGTSDSIPAMLSNGEFVTNARATKKFAPLLHAINSGKIGKYAAGGIVGAPIMASITPAGNSGGSSQSVFNINITGDVSRQTRAEIQRMIPNIATGVGMYNRELGTR